MRKNTETIFLWSFMIMTIVVPLVFLHIPVGDTTYNEYIQNQQGRIASLNRFVLTYPLFVNLFTAIQLLAAQSHFDKTSIKIYLFLYNLLAIVLLLGYIDTPSLAKSQPASNPTLINLTISRWTYLFGY